MDIWTIIGTIIFPAIAGTVGWFANADRERRTKEQENNGFLHKMQESINMLAAENKNLLREVVELRRENAVLRTEISSLNERISTLMREVGENASLREELEELNDRLSKVNLRITKKKNETDG